MARTVLPAFYEEVVLCIGVHQCMCVLACLAASRLSVLSPSCRGKTKRQMQVFAATVAALALHVHLAHWGASVSYRSMFYLELLEKDAFWVNAAPSKT